MDLILWIWSFGVPKAQVNDYSEKIEALASNLVTTLPDIQILQDLIKRNSFKESPYKTDGKTHSTSFSGLRRRFLSASNFEDRTHSTFEADTSEPVKLDAATDIHIEMHRKLQGNLTDEMVGLAELKESSLMISRSLQNTGKVLDSTEKDFEQSLASTGHANLQFVKIYSESSKTTCFTWLLMFVMTCIFIMVVVLIRVT